MEGWLYYLKYLQLCIYIAGIQIKLRDLPKKQDLITRKQEKQTNNNNQTKPKMTHILELYDKDFK